jgi:hypothetical protein
MKIQKNVPAKNPIKISEHQRRIETPGKSGSSNIRHKDAVPFTTISRKSEK